MPASDAAVLLVVAVFQLFTAPVASQVIARTAHRTHAVDRDRLPGDALADRLARDGTPLEGSGEPEPERDEDGERRPGRPAALFAGRRRPGDVSSRGRCRPRGRAAAAYPGLRAPGRAAAARRALEALGPEAGAAPRAQPRRGCGFRRPRAARARRTGERPAAGTVHSTWPRTSHASSSALAARNPVVAARSIRATGRSQRIASPASTTRGWGVRTVGRRWYEPTGNRGQSARHSCRASTTRASRVSGYTWCSRSRSVRCVFSRSAAGSTA